MTVTDPGRASRAAGIRVALSARMPSSVLRTPLSLRTLLALFAAAAVSVGGFAVGQQLQPRRSANGDAAAEVVRGLIALVPNWPAEAPRGCPHDTAAVPR